MNYQEFLSEIQNNLRAQIAPEVQLIIQSMPRNNGVSYDGLILLSPGCNISPTIYLTPYYHRYLDGVNMEDICTDILMTYRNHLPQENFDTTRFTSFEKVRSRLVMRLVNYERNRNQLSDVPHVRFCDLAIIFYCLLHADTDNQANILVHNSHLNLWGIDKDTLYMLARENTPALLPPEITPMHTILERLHCPDPDLFSESIPMYVISNCYRTNGAGVILYDQFLQQISDRFESNLILLPSSIHEMIILPVEYNSELREFTYMVREVNDTQLTDDEVLSDHAYYYDRAKQKLIME